jgi:hypothetical protein
MNTKDYAELLGLISAGVLWRQAYRASLIKLARNTVTAPVNPATKFQKLKKWMVDRQERREQKWTETDHLLLHLGLGLALLASVLRFWAD